MCWDAVVVAQASVTVRSYVPAAVTVIDWVVSPVDQLLPVALLEVRVTEPPGQKFTGPLAVIPAGFEAFNATVCEAVSVPQEVSTEMLYVPAEETEMDCVVSPFGDQVVPEA